jgi:RNA polymerase sigma factor (sigma-70 family)
VSSTPGETYNIKGLDRAGFITLVYNRYGKKLYSYAIRSWSLDEDAAWDLIYKTIYKVAESYARYTFETEDKFASFIFRIFMNYLRNHYRDHKTEKAFEFMQIEELHISGKEEENDNPNPKLKALNALLDEMEDWERMLLLMRSEGRAYSEIAAYIDKPENQLKVYYQRLKEKLERKFNGH